MVVYSLFFASVLRIKVIKAYLFPVLHMNIINVLRQRMG